jgi:dTDP-4-dehydrorhamnose reductase
VDCYADVEAVRVCEEGPLGLHALLREAWDRYHIPIAITEAHLDCTRDEQVRWLVEERAICEALRNDHVPIVALTVWSLLGSYDWNELVTVTADYYESGVFDVRSGQPRDTRLADVVRAWTAGRVFDHPVLDGEGWWRRPIRLLYPAVARGDSAPVVDPLPGRRAGTRRRIVVVDGSAAVRHEIERASHLRDIAVEFRTARELMSGPNTRANMPGDGWAMLFAGLLHEVRESEPSNLEVEQYGDLATAAADAGYHLTFFSSPHVFALPRREPYLESDAPAPLTVRGQSAATLERSLRTLDAAVLVVRPGLCFAERDHSGLATVGQPSEEGAWWPVALPPATMCSLTYLPDLIRSVLDLVIDGERGIWHLANGGALTVAQVREMRNGGMVSRHANGNAVLPYVLGSTRGPLLPDVADALERGGYDAASTSSIAPCSTSASL